MADHFLYFAYGSNMLTERLKARTPSAEPQGTGVLPGYRLTFEKPSVGRSGNSGKGDIAETRQPTDHVLGVVFKILKAEEEKLDEAEGDGYAKQELDVETNAGVRRVLVYVAREKDATVRPYHWYKALVIAGAIQHGLPASYVDSLRAVQSIADPLPRRTKKLEAEALLKRSAARRGTGTRLVSTDVYVGAGKNPADRRRDASCQGVFANAAVRARPHSGYPRSAVTAWSICSSSTPSGGRIVRLVPAAPDR